jgi:zinc protease
MRLARASNLETNGYGLGQLTSLYEAGEDPSLVWGYEETIDAHTVEMIAEAAGRHFDFENYVQVTLYPEDMR